MSVAGGILLIAAILAVCILGNLGCSALTPEGGALGAARSVGLNNPKVISEKPAFEILSGCHENDVTVFKVRGTSDAGRVRIIKVCAPALGIGGYTVRS